MEVFKTAHGSWIYPEASLLRIGGVPLFSGFMYAAIGSYIARIWRLFEIRFVALSAGSGRPGCWRSRAYVNFFSHHYVAGYPLGPVRASRRCCSAGPGSSSRRTATPRRMPMLLGFVLVGPVHLDRREPRHLRQRLDLPQPARRLERWCRSASWAPGTC